MEYFCTECNKVTQVWVRSFVPFGESAEACRGSCKDCGKACVPMTVESLTEALKAMTVKAREAIQYKNQAFRLNRKVEQLQKPIFYCVAKDKTYTYEELTFTSADSHVGMTADGKEAVAMVPQVVRSLVEYAVSLEEKLRKREEMEEDESELARLRSRVSQLTRQIEELGRRPNPQRMGLRRKIQT